MVSSKCVSFLLFHSFWDTHAVDQVVNTVTHIVDRLPPDVFEEVTPPSPPSSFSTHESFDTTGFDIPAIPTPSNGPEAERSNIIRELMETERKYVQDLEVMQVRLN
jgi:cell division control protein 24